MNRVAVFDGTTLLYHLDPDAKPPTDPDTGQPVACGLPVGHPSA